MFEGITPACAGKSIIEATSRALNEDHPRVCGEKRRMLKQTAKRPGSPPAYAGKSRKNGSYGGGKKDHPRMCGEKVLYSFGLKQVSGITPAYAGKSITVMLHTSSPEDHPRVCGEKCCLQGPYLRRLGSPPRVRGKVRLRLTYYTPSGITPACAGKRYTSTDARYRARDHPRVCGEKNQASRKRPN